jgi:lysylphosphatidylglycerol synthase-like protein
MSASVASDLDTASAPRSAAAEKIAIFAAKLLVTGACFWYVSGQIDFARVLSAAPLVDFRWAAFAVLVFLLQIPLVALRWRNVLAVLAKLDERMTRAAMIAVTTIGAFFTQVLPGVMGEGVRAWLLVRLGCDRRNALTSVVIDRGIGVGLLLALGFVILLLPSASPRSAATASWRSSSTARCSSPAFSVSCSSRSSPHCSLGGDIPVGSQRWQWMLVAFSSEPGAP